MSGSASWLGARALMGITVASRGHLATRRQFIAWAAGVGAAVALPPPFGAAATGEIKLTAAKARLPVVGAGHPDTDVWCYAGRVPGPEIRIRQGETLRVSVENRLPEATTVHWHGIRLPIAMDGVPHLSQPPIAPGENFVYEFKCPDAGTFWYHPHQNSDVQLGRGLYGALIVEEREPLPVSRDITWVLSDLRLRKDASISDDFGNMHDVSHNGRIGNTVTINGRVQEQFSVRAGERIRLRLINAANARIFGLSFDGHRPHVVARDGQPIEPHAPEQIVLGPGMRIDLVLDLAQKPGQRFRVIDGFYRQLEYRLVDLVYSDDLPVRGFENTPIRPLAPNPVPEPNLSAAQRHEINLEGGMMGMVRGGMAEMRRMMQRRLAWTMNGMASAEHVPEPLLTLKRGTTCVLNVVNETAWHHPMHLHGHAFRVLARNGRATQYREWQDTVLVDPKERAEIAFVADQPGDWMFHCHILEHQIGGMMSTIRIE
jgi:FtsP/CotA-like multicopper oxidase with cupredoxin domain